VSLVPAGVLVAFVYSFPCCRLTTSGICTKNRNNMWLIYCGLCLNFSLLVNFRYMLQTISITVGGIVQGVYYRQSTKEKALELGISGIVKNLPDGNVHILATGTGDQLDQLVQWCKQGPRNAVVNSVNVEEVEEQKFFGFTIQR
jgi:acylphosphatase